MSVNFMKLHNPTNQGKSRLGNYSDSVLELDANLGRNVIRAEAPDTIVVFTADNGAWQDAWPDAGVTPFRGEQGSAFEGAFRVPGHQVTGAPSAPRRPARSSPTLPLGQVKSVVTCGKGVDSPSVVPPRGRVDKPCWP